MSQSGGGSPCQGEIILEALAAYLASAVSQGDMGAPRTRRSRTVVPTKAASVRSPAKAIPAAAAQRVFASANPARTRSDVAAKRPAQTG